MYQCFSIDTEIVVGNEQSPQSNSRLCNVHPSKNMRMHGGAKKCMISDLKREIHSSNPVPALLEDEFCNRSGTSEPRQKHG